MSPYLHVSNVNRLLELKNILCFWLLYWWERWQLANGKKETGHGSENLFHTCQETCLPVGFRMVILLQRILFLQYT